MNNDLHAALYIDPDGAVIIASAEVTVRIVAYNDEGNVVALGLIPGGQWAAFEARLARLRLFGMRVWETFFRPGYEAYPGVEAVGVVHKTDTEFQVRTAAWQVGDAYHGADTHYSVATLNGPYDNIPDTGRYAEDVALVLHAHLLPALG